MFIRLLFFFSLFLTMSCTVVKSHVPHKKALVIQNFRFDPLGFLEEELKTRGFQVFTLDAEHYGHHLSQIDPLSFDLVVVLGGLMGAYEDERYGYLKDEMNIFKARRDKNLASIGICLGSQLMARAFGADVYVGQNGGEFGVKKLIPTKDGLNTPFKDLSEYPVFESHKDTFDLPKGATLLASTSQYKNQAFLSGKSLALQFHPEVNADTIRIWMDIFQRNDNQEMLKNLSYVDTKLRPQIIRFWHNWLDILEV